MSDVYLETRQQILAATLTCALESGFSFTVEEVARRAGVSRATVYRYFEGGKDDLVSQAVSWEVGRFFATIEREVRDEPDLAAKIERALSFGRSALDHHQVLQRILREDPDRLLPELELTMPIVFAGLQTYLETLLEGETLAEGVSPGEAAEYLARLFLSYLGSEGSWDLGDPEQVRRLVRSQFLAGVLA